MPVRGNQVVEIMRQRLLQRQGRWAVLPGRVDDDIPADIAADENSTRPYSLRVVALGDRPAFGDAGLVAEAAVQGLQLALERGREPGAVISGKLLLGDLGRFEGFQHLIQGGAQVSILGHLAFQFAGSCVFIAPVLNLVGDQVDAQIAQNARNGRACQKRLLARGFDDRPQRRCGEHGVSRVDPGTFHPLPKTEEVLFECFFPGSDVECHNQPSRRELLS